MQTIVVQKFFSNYKNYCYRNRMEFLLKFLSNHPQNLLNGLDTGRKYQKVYRNWQYYQNISDP